MSKKFIDKPCAYCVTSLSSTADHIFAREFFAPGQRQRLPKVPACVRCNNSKSQLEHYVTSTLPFGGRHRDASLMLNQFVPRRLAMNQKLARELSEGQTRTTLELAPGTMEEVLLVPFDGEKFERLFEMIVRALLVHHCGEHLDSDHGIRVISVTPFGEELFAPLLNMNSKQEVNGNLGNGTFVYVGKQAVDDPQLTVWGFSAYGGAMMTDGIQPDTTRGLVAVTGRHDLIGRLFASMEGQIPTFPKTDP